MNKKKIIFFGSSDFSIESLKAIGSNHDVRVIITKPDVRAKRGNRLEENIVAKEGKAFSGTIIKKYRSLKPREVIDEVVSLIRELDIDIGIVVSYGNIIPREIFEAPRYATFNLHASLLPKYRGAAPIRCALLNGDKETGVCIQKITEKLDAGDIYLEEKVAISDEDDYNSLSSKLSKLGAELLLKFLERSPQDFSPKVQNEDEASYCGKVSKDELIINWGNSALSIFNRVRAFADMGAITFFRGKRLKIFKAKVVDGNYDFGEFGEVVDINRSIGVVVSTGDGFISVLEVQPENKRKMNFLDFVNGYRIKKGDIFHE